MSKPIPFEAPPEACLTCFEGYTDTFFAFEGEAEFIMAMLHVQLDISQDEAQELVFGLAADQYGCAPGHVPIKPMRMIIRICAKCADEFGMQAAPLDNGIPCYGQMQFQRMTFLKGLEGERDSGGEPASDIE